MKYKTKFDTNMLPSVQVTKYRFFEENKAELCHASSGKMMYVADIQDIILQNDMGEKDMLDASEVFNSAFRKAWIALNETYNKTENFIVRFRNSTRAKYMPCVLVTMSIQEMTQYQNGGESGLTLLTGLRVGRFNNDTKTYSFDDKFFHIQTTSLFYDAVYFMIGERFDTYLAYKAMQAFQFGVTLPEMPKMLMSSVKPIRPWEDISDEANKQRQDYKEALMVKEDGELIYNYHTRYVKTENPKRRSVPMHRVTRPVSKYCCFPRLKLDGLMCVNKSFENHLMDCVAKRPIDFVGRSEINEYVIVSNQDLL